MGVSFHRRHPIAHGTVLLVPFQTKEYHRDKVENYFSMWRSFGSAAELNSHLCMNLELAVSDYKWKSIITEGSYLQQKMRTDIS